MNRITHMLVAGSLLSVATLAGASANASAASSCIGTIAVPRTSDPAAAPPYLRDPAFPGSPYKEPSTPKVAVSIASGTYLVTAGSEDDTHASGPSFEPEDEQNERWYAVFFAADGTTVVGTTSLTPDLAWNSLSATFVLADLVLTGPAAFVQYFHPTGGATRGSVAVSCLGLSPAGYPPKPGGTTETTTTTTTTTPIGVNVGPNVTTSTVAATPVGSGGGTSGGATSTTVGDTGATTGKVAGVTLNAPTTAVPVAAPAVPPTAEVAASPISFTGAQSTLLAGVAAALTALGGLFLVIGRRRQANTPKI